jgi:hypothetical protein
MTDTDQQKRRTCPDFRGCRADGVPADCEWCADDPDPIDNTIASARLSGIEPTSEDRERMERLRSTIRGRKALYEGLAAIHDADDTCPHGKPLTWKDGSRRVCVACNVAKQLERNDALKARGASEERERIMRDVQALGFRFDEGGTDWIRRDEVLDAILNEVLGGIWMGKSDD